ncbi:MAG: NUDIX hydrolase [Saccharofermentanales bacterium]
MINEKEYFDLINRRPNLFTNPKVIGLIEVKTERDEIINIENIVKDRLRKKNLPESWGDVGIVYKDQYLFIVRDAVMFSDGSFGTYIRTISDDNSFGVVILPIFKGKVVLEKHFRHSTRMHELEIPRGFPEPGLTDIENAKKEIFEEIGGVIDDITYLGSMYENTGIGSGIAKIFRANLKSIGSIDVVEGISNIELYDIITIKKMIKDDIIKDAYTLVALAKSGLL